MDKSKIDNSLSWSERILVNNKQENSVLLFVEPLDLTKETVVGGLDDRRTSQHHLSLATWDAAVKEFEETGKIPGGIFLTGNGKLIWISHYDLDVVSSNDDDVTP